MILVPYRDVDQWIFEKLVMSLRLTFSRLYRLRGPQASLLQPCHLCTWIERNQKCRNSPVNSNRTFDPFSFQDFLSHNLSPSPVSQHQRPRTTSVRKEDLTNFSPAIMASFPPELQPVMFSLLLHAGAILSDRFSPLDLGWRPMEKPFGGRSSGTLILLIGNKHLLLVLIRALAGLVWKDQEGHASSQW